MPFFTTKESRKGSGLGLYPLCVKCQDIADPGLLDPILRGQLVFELLSQFITEIDLQ